MDKTVCINTKRSQQYSVITDFKRYFPPQTEIISSWKVWYVETEGCLYTLSLRYSAVLTADVAANISWVLS